eukprot:scaffold78813_cov87-Phaeocystis_antarctica.AAC.2
MRRGGAGGAQRASYMGGRPQTKSSVSSAGGKQYFWIFALSIQPDRCVAGEGVGARVGAGGKRCDAPVSAVYSGVSTQPGGAGSSGPLPTTCTSLSRPVRARVRVRVRVRARVRNRVRARVRIRVNVRVRASARAARTPGLGLPAACLDQALSSSLSSMSSTLLLPYSSTTCRTSPGVPSSFHNACHRRGAGRSGRAGVVPGLAPTRRWCGDGVETVSAVGTWAHLVHGGEPGAGAQQGDRLLAVERVRRLDVEADVLEADLSAQLETVQPLRDGAAVVPLDTQLKLAEHRVVGHGRVRADGVRPVEVVLAVRATAPARCLQEDAGADGQ